MGINGIAANDEAQSNPAQVAAAVGLVQKLEEGIRPVVGTLVRGILTGAGGVQPHIILNLIAFHVGYFLGCALQGDINTMARVRKGFREAFDQGLRKAPIIQAVQPGQPPMAPAMPEALKG